MEHRDSGSGNNGRGRGRGGHRGRGRGGRGRGGPVTEADAPSLNNPPAHTEAENEEDVRVQLPDAFAVSFPHVNRVKERGRAFVVPNIGSHVLPDGTVSTATETAAKRIFLVAERTIAGLDDIVYEKHRDVWENLPRGNARVFVLPATTDDQTAAAGRVKELEDKILELASCGDPERPLQTVTAISREQLTPVAAINGLRKFSYNDKPTDSKKGDYGYEEQVDAVVALEKENGECGHISAFTIHPSPCAGSQAEERYWVLGSKNVHIVLPYRFTEADVRDTYKAKRYGYAAKIALQWKDIMDMADANANGGCLRDQKPPQESACTGDRTGVDPETFKNVTPASLLRFHDLLSQNNYTACFEAIFRDSQHLVDYKNRNEFRFFALTDNATYERPTYKEKPNSEVHGLCVDIQTSFKMFADCGMPTAPIFYGNQVVDNQNFTQLHKTPYKSESYDALVDAIGHRQNSEGCVMYGYRTTPDANGPVNRVVKVWKEKAYPYVMERATREAIVNHKLAGTGLEAKIRKKLAIQKPHIRKYFADWEKERLPFLMVFSAYLQVTGKLTPHMTRDESFMAIRNNWLSLQREFAEKMETDVELRTVCQRFVPGDHANEEGSAPDGPRRTREMLRLDVIKFVGAQGCGKSTMSRILFFLLAEANFRPRWLNQDEAGNRNNYLAAIRKAVQDAHTVQDMASASGSGNGVATMKDGRITHLMLDKMNLDQRTNSDYNCLPEPAVTVFFTFENESGEPTETQENARKQHEMTELLLSRVVHRGSGHRTIRIADGISPVEKRAEANKIKKFLSQAVRACQFPEEDDNIVLVDITESLEAQITRIWTALQENGFYEVPNLDTLHLSLAIDVARRYESILTKQGRAPLYASLSVLPSEHAKLLSVVDPATLVDKRVQNEFHVTTKYFVGDPDPLYLVALAELEGRTEDLELASVAADDKGVAIRIRNERDSGASVNEDVTHDGKADTEAPGCANDIVAYLLAKAGVPGVTPRSLFPCANAIAHITIANAPKVPPVYSNELLAKDPGTPIPGKVTVKAKYTFN